MKNKELVLKKLDITDLKSLIDLQDKIIAGFKPDEQHFILHRTANDFLKALESDSTYVFGLFDGERLVSQSILSLPKDGEERELSEFAGELKNSELAIYKAVLVDPEYRGNGLMKRMLRIREDTAIMNGRHTAITQIAADNPASWVNAIQYGMQITKVGYDPEDNAEVIYLQKRLDGKIDPKLNMDKSFSMSLGKDVHKQVPILFNKMQELSKRGMVGTAWNSETNSIIWNPRENEGRLLEDSLTYTPAERPKSKMFKPTDIISTNRVFSK